MCICYAAKWAWLDLVASSSTSLSTAIIECHSMLRPNAIQSS